MMLFAWFGCVAVPDGPGAAPPEGMVVSTTDFTAGALAAVSIEGALVDGLFATSGDPMVSADGAWVVLLDRAPPAAIRLFEAPDLAAPVREFSLPPGGNPQDAAVCGERLFVPMLDSATLPWWSLGDAGNGAVDLSAYADDDGSPEAATVVRVDEQLYVGLQRLRAEGPVWEPEGEGRVVAIDCATAEIVDDWPTGPNPSVHRAAAIGDLWVRTGVWGRPDGALSRLNVASGAMNVVVDEATLGWDLGDVVDVDGTLGIVGAAFDWSENVAVCVPPGGDPAVMAQTGAYLSAIAADASGQAWVAHSLDYAEPDAPHGLRAYDLSACAPLGEGLVPTLLPPYALAAYAAR